MIWTYTYIHTHTHTHTEGAMQILTERNIDIGMSRKHKHQGCVVHYCYCLLFTFVILERVLICDPNQLPFILSRSSSLALPLPLSPGATSAPCLIFIFPAIFYIRIVPTDQEPMNSRPKIQVSSSPSVLMKYYRLQEDLIRGQSLN